MANVWTIYAAEQTLFPDVEDTEMSGQHLRAYTAGIFDLDADLSAADLPNAKIRYGIVIRGDAFSSWGKCVIDGVVHDSFSIPYPIYRLSLSYWTNYFGEYIGLYPGGGIAGRFRALLYTGDGWLNLEHGLDVGGKPYGFSTKNSKIGWYVDQNTGFGAGVMAYNFCFRSQVGMAYTLPYAPGYFDWDLYLTTNGAGDEYYYDGDSVVDWHINLGGYAPSWGTAGGGEDFYSSASYRIGLERTSSTATKTRDGGYKYPENEPPQIRTYVRQHFLVTSPRSDKYFAPDAQGHPEYLAPGAGKRVYPGVSSTRTFPDASDDDPAGVVAVNFGLPVLYEQWFQSGIPDLDGPQEFWTQRASTIEEVN